MRRIAIAGGLLALALALAAFWLLRYRSAPLPELPGELARGSLEHEGRTRRWRAYLPARSDERPALVLVLHGSLGDGAQARSGYAYEFDRLSEEHGFVPIYPDGFEKHWNDCRRAGPYSAKRLGVDDVGFLRALVARFVAERGADPSRVFATGISNGGQMALRLALEAPDLVRAVAPVAAALPAGENLDCRPSDRAVSVLIMNGTRDPMNPWGGGDVALYGLLGNRGAVLSTEASIDHFRDLAGHEGAPEVTELPDLAPDDGSRVEVRRWRAPGRAQVELYAILGGGHGAPHPEIVLPRLLGPSNRDIRAAAEIWRFFAEAP